MLCFLLVLLPPLVLFIRTLHIIVIVATVVIITSQVVVVNVKLVKLLLLQDLLLQYLLKVEVFQRSQLYQVAVVDKQRLLRLPVVQHFLVVIFVVVLAIIRPLRVLPRSHKVAVVSRPKVLLLLLLLLARPTSVHRVVVVHYLRHSGYVVLEGRGL